MWIFCASCVKKKKETTRLYLLFWRSSIHLLQVNVLHLIFIFFFTWITQFFCNNNIVYFCLKKKPPHLLHTDNDKRMKKRLEIIFILLGEKSANKLDKMEYKFAKESSIHRENNVVRKEAIYCRQKMFRRILSTSYLWLLCLVVNIKIKCRHTILYIFFRMHLLNFFAAKEHSQQNNVIAKKNEKKQTSKASREMRTSQKSKRCCIPCELLPKSSSSSSCLVDIFFTWFK